MPHILTAGEIAEILQGTMLGDASIEIHGPAKIEEAGPQHITFVANPKYARFLEFSEAGVILVSAGLERKSGSMIVVDDPYLSFVKLLEVFYPAVQEVAVGIHSTAVVDESAVLGKHVSIGACCVIDANARIGDGTVLYPHVWIGREVVLGSECTIHSQASLRHSVVLGNRVVIQDSTVLGSDGFGYAEQTNGFRKIPQVGNVIIEDDVEIGAGTTVDRATIGSTIIRQGTKIDNLCQIAHNVVIGAHCVIAAQTGIAGSTSIGDKCKIGGQVGIVGHLKIGDGAMFGAQSGISNNVEAGAVISGSPARPISLWRRIEASLNRLPTLLKRVRELEKQLDEQKLRSSEKLP